jgi:hypothetical protein
MGNDARERLEQEMLLREIDDLVDTLLGIAGNRPDLYVCANTDFDDTFEYTQDSGHKIVYLRQQNERLCPDCGQESLRPFMFGDALVPLDEDAPMLDERPEETVQLYDQVLARFDALMALAAPNPPVKLRCPHAGRETTYCPPGTRHKSFYLSRRSGDPCPDCLHASLV